MEGTVVESRTGAMADADDGRQAQAASRAVEVDFVPAGMYHLIDRRLYFSAHESKEQTVELIKAFPKLFFFSSFIPESYMPFCADFGPLDIANVLQFVCDIKEKMDHPLLKSQNRILVFYTSANPAAVTNAAFLMCCYLVLEKGLTPPQAVARFSRVAGLPIVPFRDATWNRSTFHLTILDCLEGLQRAISLKWIDQRTFSTSDYEALCEQPEHDMCRVHPKFVAFATPRNRPNEEFKCARPPSAHTRHFGRLGVTDVVRLCEEGFYDDSDFASGFAHHALEFDDCTSPPAEVVERFLDICDASGGGTVAVHCLAGLGRTGTLIACHMIKHSGFSAAEAIGYLRLMRPGSVIGPQQHFLESIEAASWRGNRPLLGGESACEGAGEPQVAEVADSLRALTMGRDVATGSAIRLDAKARSRATLPGEDS
uniref:protein-tyrosine-phosphatase n=2 Tax=Hemiselmis andersenii TaxID=464988 RepID=A0A7S0UE54_HEMAN|mmetsp:Transcript_970/g.2280  ORF Transcript_970/g.2280 Transcript_970/m.2280 type:complete len:427 (+) Transcript_970:23-1303(+)